MTTMENESTMITYIDHDNHICYGFFVAAHWDDKLQGYTVRCLGTSETVFVDVNDVVQDIDDGLDALFCEGEGEDWDLNYGHLKASKDR